MSDGLSAAKVVLLAVQLASTANVDSLRYLVATRSTTLLRGHLILRILLTFLPETLDATSYIPLLHDITSDDAQDPPKPAVFPSLDQDIGEEDARKKVRKLHLLPLARPSAPKEVDLDFLTQFIIHRAHRIDSEAGLLPQVLALVVPFLDHSEYIRTWTIVTLLPLYRFSYNYYPEEKCLRSLKSMSSLTNAEGVRFLLSKAEKEGKNGYEFIGRDLKGLIGPWMYGDWQKERGKNRSSLDMAARTILPLDGPQSENTQDSKFPGWDEVDTWIISQADGPWSLAVDVITQWDGPGDVDLGGYEGSSTWLQEEDQQVIELRYARTALATAYSIKDESIEALAGIHRILSRIISLLDFERIPTLEASASLLPSIDLGLDSDILRLENAKYLRNFLLEEQNILTSPTKQATSLLFALTVSAYILTRADCPCSLRKAGELALIQNEREQKNELHRYLNTINQKSKNDDKYWIRVRNELLWLRDWTSDSLSPSVPEFGNGILGRINKEYLESEILKALLANSRFSLAQSIYGMHERPLPEAVVGEIALSAARVAFENATNGNKTRGGVKRCLDTINAFSDVLKDSSAKDRLLALVDLSHQLSQYKIHIRPNQPLKPIDIVVNKDPLAIIGILLDLNPSSYTQLNEMCRYGDLMVQAGLVQYESNGDGPITPKEGEELAEKRVSSMCVDAALANDDFETAYSYVMNNLTRSSVKPGEIDESDDWSWRAALQAGKYRRNSNTTKPTHVGNAYANPEIRHLEQRMECLSRALHLAPKSTLPEILNAWRRCEEELKTQMKLEEEAEEEHDNQGDRQVDLSSHGHSIGNAQAASEAPVSLFELGRRTAENAKKSLASLNASQARDAQSKRPETADHDGQPASAGGVRPDTVRKRDQLRNAAVGTLASGIGWLINAEPVNHSNQHDEDN